MSSNLDPPVLSTQIGRGSCRRSSLPDLVDRQNRNHDGECIHAAVVLDRWSRAGGHVSGTDEGRVQGVEQLGQLGDLGTPVTNETASVQATWHGCSFKSQVVRDLAVQPQTGEISVRVAWIEEAVHLPTPKCCLLYTSPSPRDRTR